MPTSCTGINLQRNSKVFFSSVDLASGENPNHMTPANTYEVEVLAGFALSASAATQDITSLESGLTPDRSQQRFNTSIEPVNWNFQCYIKPTGAENTGSMDRTRVTTPTASGVTITGAALTDDLIRSNAYVARTSLTGNSMPVADWFMWQALVSNTKFTNSNTSSSNVQSVWRTGGILRTDNATANTTSVLTDINDDFELSTDVSARPARAAAFNANVGTHSSRTNIGRAQENHLYFKLDDKYYQVTGATVNQATVDASIEDIAMTTWSGFGTTMVDLGDIEAGRTGNDMTPADNAHRVLGGSANADTLVYTTYGVTGVPGSSPYNSGKYHPFNEMNVRAEAGTALITAPYDPAPARDNDFIQARLSEIQLTHRPEGQTNANTYTFPVTAISFDYNNNITYLTPEELSRLNEPIGQFTGARAITGSLTMYLKGGNEESAQFLKSIYEDSRPKLSDHASANLWIGGQTGSHIQFDMRNCQFEFPQTSIEDVISMSVNFVAQQAEDECDGGEVIISAYKEAV